MRRVPAAGAAPGTLPVCPWRPAPTPAYPEQRTPYVSMITFETPHGQASAHLHPAERARGALIMGHGAGGGVEAPDLVAATRAAVPEGFSVALVEQPYRVAGKRSQPAASTLDAAWTAVVEQLASGELRGLPLVVGGRSAGARVACRMAEATGAVAVLCLAFPLQPPPRKGKAPGPSRIDELDAVKVPVLVVQGERDRFGLPPPGKRREVVVVPGDHSLRSDHQAVAAAAGGWLAKLAL
jgi:predicted alpha/beta-hydrolase family hydrolase